MLSRAKPALGRRLRRLSLRRVDDSHAGRSELVEIMSQASGRLDEAIRPQLVAWAQQTDGSGACDYETASTHPPSLRYADTEATATATDTSVSTGLASHLSGGPLLEEHNGILHLPPPPARPPVFECAFWFLGCGAIFPGREEWETHCRAHFRGEDPPRRVQCPLCDWQTACDDGTQAWDLRMHHLADHHTMLGHTLRTSRPDFHLFQHLWQKRLIGDQDLKELRGGNHNLVTPLANFVETNASQGRRRRNRTPHATQHVAAGRESGPRRA